MVLTFSNPAELQLKSLILNLIVNNVDSENIKIQHTLGIQIHHVCNVL